MRILPLIAIAAGLLCGCAREGLRPVIALPRDAVPSEKADLPDVVAFEGTMGETEAP